MRKFRVLNPTYLKSSTKQSSELKIEELIALPEGDILLTEDKIKEVDGHYEVTLKRYVFKEHLVELKEPLTNNVSLEFVMTLSDRPIKTLLYGELTLKIGTEKIKYLATSGAAGYQNYGNYWTQAKSPIPPGNYTVITPPYQLNTKGIEGLFFPITPDPIIGANGQKRTEIGLHHDANVPGSAGCLVIVNKPSFQSFCDRIKKTSVKKIPLIVQYSH